MPKKPVNIKGIKSVDKSFKRASKKLNKKINKATKKLNKKINKFVKQKAKERAKAKKKKESVYNKRKNQLKRYADKALALNEETQRMVDNFRRSGYKVDNTKQLQDVKERIEEALQTTRPNQRLVDLIKEYTKANTYDYIKVELPIRKDDNKDVDSTEDIEVTFRKIRLARRRQVLNPGSVSDEDAQILSKVGQTTPYTQTISLPDPKSDEEIEKFKKKFNKVRDISIGGNSTLINDLSYTYDALWEGRKFVENMQKIMSDPKEFVRIEAWYQSDDEDAEKARSDIGSAIKSDWYDKFKDFSATIIEFINKLPSLSKEAEDVLNSYADTLEVSADEVSGF